MAEISRPWRRGGRRRLQRGQARGRRAPAWPRPSSAFGTVDILVNNANVAPYGPLLEVTDKAFDLGFRVGPLAMLRFMRAATRTWPTAAA